MQMRAQHSDYCLLRNTTQSMAIFTLEGVASRILSPCVKGASGSLLGIPTRRVSVRTGGGVQSLFKALTHTHPFQPGINAKGSS